MALLDVSQRNELEAVFRQVASSEEKFPIYLDDYAKWIGVNRPRNVIKTLVRSYALDVDYTQGEYRSSSSAQKRCRSSSSGEVCSPSVVGKRGGHNKKHYWLSVNCFQHLCMRAGTSLAQEVRQFYIDVVTAVRRLCQQSEEKAAQQWRIDRNAGIDATKAKSQILLKNVPYANGKDFATTNAEITRAVLGKYPGQFKRDLGVSRHRRTRNFCTRPQLGVIIGLEQKIEQIYKENPGKTRDELWPEIKRVTDAAYLAMDLMGQHGKFLEAPPANLQLKQ